MVHYRAKGGHDGRTLPAGDAAEAFDPAEFVARVIMHIPEPRRHLYGWYSNVCRGKRRKAEVENGEVGGAGAGPASRAARAEARDARALRRSWAQLIKMVPLDNNLTS